jgi:hypothetical protein
MSRAVSLNEVWRAIGKDSPEAIIRVAAKVAHAPRIIAATAPLYYPRDLNRPIAIASDREDRPVTDEADKRGQLIRHLEDALSLADEIEDGQTGFLIERALDEARSRQFRPIG